MLKEKNEIYKLNMYITLIYTILLFSILFVICISVAILAQHGYIYLPSQYAWVAPVVSQ